MLRAGRHGGAWLACRPVFRICVRHAAAVRDGAASGGRMGPGTAAVCRNIGAGRYPRLPTVRRRKNIIYMGMEKKRLPKTCPACGSTSGSSDLLNKIHCNIDNIYYCVNIIKQYVCLFMSFV